MTTRLVLLGLLLTLTRFAATAEELNVIPFGTPDSTAPKITNSVPAPGATVEVLRTVEVFFDEPVTNVTAGDLLINGVPATDVQVLDADQYVFGFQEPPAGIVQVTWAANHGIQDLAVPANPWVATNWTYSLAPETLFRQIQISEFMADNNRSLNDDDGDSSDWIELFNPTDEPVDLSGWFLSNDTNRPALWRFPAIDLAPNSYLVVFASEKNRTNPAAKLHTNFKLAREGGFLVLSDPRTNSISAFSPYPVQNADVSYGRERNNPAVIGYYTKSSPGAANTGGGPGFAPDVMFSRAGGTYREAFDLVLSTTSTNAVIRYALGRTNLPTETSPIYTGPLRITNTVQVRARAFVPGLLSGEPNSESYVFLSTNVVNFTSDLPIIILHNHQGGAVPATGAQFVMMQVFEPRNGIASITNVPDISQRAIFRRRGSSTEGYAKPSFSLETRNEFEGDERIKLLGMPEESDWIFYAPNNFEPILIHNPLAYDLSRQMGRYATRTRFAEVYLNTTGGLVTSNNYSGIYVVEEKIKRGPDRVDIDKIEAENLTEPSITGGYMFKIDRLDPGDSGLSAAGQTVAWVDPKEPVIRTAARRPQLLYVSNYFRQFGTALNGTNWFDPTNGYAKYIDVPSWIDHHVHNVITFNVDALRLSAYFYKPRNGKIEFGPVWDFDRTLNSTDGRDANPKVWRSQVGDLGTDFFGYTWWGRMFRDTNFWQAWIDRYEDTRKNVFSLTNFNATVDKYANEVRAAQPREFAKWRIATRGGSYQAEVNSLKTWFSNRVSFIDSELVRPPAFSIAPGQVTNGTTLTLTGPAVGKIFYTLDGSDPRTSGGGTSAVAQVYSGPITIDKNTRIFARVNNPAHTRGPAAGIRSYWSGPIQATFVTETPKLAITEIMYNPAAPAVSNTYTNEDFEYIELKNIGTTPLNLAGFKFTRGIDFTFTGGTLNAGERTVLVKNRAAFQTRYGSTVAVAGEYTGLLDNGGDRLTLEGPAQEPIHDFSYADGWYPVTDGLGFSLVLRDENTAFSAYGQASSWRASGAVGGSPSGADPAAPAFPQVFVNEIMSNPLGTQTDAIELFNPGSAAAAIGGWYLSDDFSTPKKYRIPAGTTLGPGAYLVFNESQFNTGTSGFGFSARGDAIYLFSADAAGELTGYAHGFEFGPAAPGATFGRHVSSESREHFVAQIVPSLGAANSGPRIGPVVISEIMYQPAPYGTAGDNTLEEYIELQNISSQTIQLFDPAHRTNTWHLRGGTDLDLPMDISLPPNGTALLVNFNPVLDPAAADVFRARYGIPATVPLFGPYSGNLNNDDETLRIVRPDAPVTSGSDAGTVPYITVDELNYSGLAPWPSGANATGKSIQRLNTTGFGGDPATWFAGVPTPGALNAGSGDTDGDGLPDAWESANSLNPNDATGINGASGDPDSDGVTNLTEYMTGTDPRNATSYLRINSIAVSGGRANLEFSAAPGQSYSLHSRSNLITGTWNKVADFLPSSEPVTNRVQDPQPATGNRFYRVVTPRQ
jgi:hypothetical protein